MSVAMPDTTGSMNRTGPRRRSPRRSVGVTPGESSTSLPTSPPARSAASTRCRSRHWLKAVTRIDALFDIEHGINGETAERRLVVRREQSAGNDVVRRPGSPMASTGSREPRRLGSTNSFRRTGKKAGDTSRLHSPRFSPGASSPPFIRRQTPLETPRGARRMLTAQRLNGTDGVRTGVGGRAAGAGSRSRDGTRRG